MMIDLRSDTVTQPTSQMREVMAKAIVGDDVYEEDPTVNHLQELAAKKMGKEAGLFVPSGTMANLLAVLTFCQRGDEVMMGDLGHTFLFEGGGVSALGGVVIHTLPNQKNGTIDLEKIESSIRVNDIHHPISKLLILENTHNRCGGVVLSPAYTHSAGDLIHSHNLFLHLDGARIFNAAVAIGVQAKDLAAPADSVTFCLSKGLCAPIGSVLCGSIDFISRARRIRKMLGGGMRQAGVLAAPGIVALETMVERLKEDHQRALILAKELSMIPGIILDNKLPETNMVFILFSDRIKKSAKDIQAELKEKDIRIGLVGVNRARMVTHYWISDKDIDHTIQAFKSILK
jgi:threonine aldolase